MRQIGLSRNYLPTVSSTKRPSRAQKKSSDLVLIFSILTLTFACVLTSLSFLSSTGWNDQLVESLSSKCFLNFEHVTVDERIKIHYQLGKENLVNWKFSWKVFDKWSEMDEKGQNDLLRHFIHWRLSFESEMPIKMSSQFVSRRWWHLNLWSHNEWTNCYYTCRRYSWLHTHDCVVQSASLLHFTSVTNNRHNVMNDSRTFIHKAHEHWAWTQFRKNILSFRAMMTELKREQFQD